MKSLFEKIYFAVVCVPICLAVMAITEIIFFIYRLTASNKRS
jgi:hypothetical protein